MGARLVATSSWHAAHSALAARCKADKIEPLSPSSAQSEPPEIIEMGSDPLVHAKTWVRICCLPGIGLGSGLQTELFGRTINLPARQLRMP